MRSNRERGVRTRMDTAWRSSVAVVLILLTTFSMATVYCQSLQIGTKCEPTNEFMDIISLENCRWRYITGGPGVDLPLEPPKPSAPPAPPAEWECVCDQYKTEGAQILRCQDYLACNGRFQKWGDPYYRTTGGAKKKIGEVILAKETTPSDTPDKKCDPCEFFWEGTLKVAERGVVVEDNESQQMVLPEPTQPGGAYFIPVPSENISVPPVEVIVINWSSIYETYGPIKVPPKEEPAPTEEVPAPPEVVLETPEVEIASPVELVTI